MAFAEARAAWQRTANRCLVQEDAKRAPKLACCSTITPAAKHTDTEQASASVGQDIPNTGSLPFNRAPSNLSPSSRWWLQFQPHYSNQKGLINEKLNSENMHTLPMHESSEVSYEDVKMENDFEAFYSDNFQEPRDEVSKNTNELYFDSESSWIGAEKNSPWWRTADTDELAYLVSQSSSELVENCDLPRPCNTHLKKDLKVKIPPLDSHENSKSSLDWKLDAGFEDNFDHFVYTPIKPTLERSCPKLAMKSEKQLEAGLDKPLSQSHMKMSKMQEYEMDASKVDLLKALRHSQTRARQAETAAKQASKEKEHVIKLVFRQASQLFAYKQWVQLLQLENMYFQLKDTTQKSGSTISPTVYPWTPLKTRKVRKVWQKSWSRRRAKRARPQYDDIGKYAVVFALGLGLVGAGLILGWTIGWMLW